MSNEIKPYYGPLAAIVESIFMQPVEMLKTLKQSGQLKSNLPGLIKEPFKFYRGYNAFLSGMLCKYSVRFTVISESQSRLNSLNMSYYLINPISGFTAGFTEAFVMTPFEFMKTRLQARDPSHKNKSNYQLIKTIVEENGVKGFYRGFLSTALRQSINQCVNISFYYYIRNQDWYVVSPSNTFILGLISGSLGPLINHPSDVIKTRYMNNKRFKYNSLKDAIKDIIKKEGILFLFTSGLSLRLLRVGVGQSIVFSVIEFLKKQDSMKSH